MKGSFQFKWASENEWFGSRKRLSSFEQISWHQLSYVARSLLLGLGLQRCQMSWSSSRYVFLFQDIEGVRNDDLPRHTINTLQVYGQEKYLVLQVLQALKTRSDKFSCPPVMSWSLIWREAQNAGQRISDEILMTFLTRNKPLNYYKKTARSLVGEVHILCWDFLSAYTPRDKYDFVKVTV